MRFYRAKMALLWVGLAIIFSGYMYHAYLRWHCPGDTETQTTMKIFGYFEECRK